MALRVKQGRKYYYQGRDYVGGEEVVVPEKYHRLLTHAKGPLEYTNTSTNPTDLPEKAPTAADGDDVAALRSEYEIVVGRRPFMGWDAAQLKDKMNTYRRRDMQAE